LSVIAVLPDKTAEILVWSGILVVAVLVLFVVTLTVKRRLDTHAGPTGDRPPFTLDELRRMRATGDIDDEQYEKARASIVALTRGGETPGAPVEPAPPGPPADEPHEPEPADNHEQPDEEPRRDTDS